MTPAPIEDSDQPLVTAALQGSMPALDDLVRRHQSWIFNLALRMVWRREAAEDATQEILIKAVTKLGTFAGRSLFRTWLYRIAVNHLLNARKSEMEEQKMSFRGMGNSLDGVPDEELPDEQTLSIETRLFVEEAKLGCITAMLMCLDRRQRLAYILGEVFGEKSESAAEIMAESAANFRQLLSRARHDLYQFMNGRCGLINQANPCRCARKANGFRKNGWLDPQNLQFSKDRMAAVRDLALGRLEELQELDRRHAELYRAQPVLAGPDLAGRIRAMLEQSGFDVF